MALSAYLAYRAKLKYQEDQARQALIQREGEATQGNMWVGLLIIALIIVIIVIEIMLLIYAIRVILNCVGSTVAKVVLIILLFVFPPLIWIIAIIGFASGCMKKK